MNNEKWLNECKPGEIRSLTSSDGSSATIAKLEADRSELEAANSVIANLKLANEKLLARISELNEGREHARSQSPDEIRRIARQACNDGIAVKVMYRRSKGNVTEHYTSIVEYDDSDIPIRLRNLDPQDCYAWCRIAEEWSRIAGGSEGIESIELLA